MANDYEINGETTDAIYESSHLTKGCSMRPLFKQHRDIITVNKNVGEIKRGDVVLYPSLRTEDLILHRVIKVNGDELLIRGDNTYVIEHRKKDEIIGVLTSFYRKGKYCDCKKSKAYKIYSTIILNTYPIRFFWKIKLRPRLVKIAKCVFRLLGIKRRKK